jgi:hypothetical protein
VAEDWRLTVSLETTAFAEHLLSALKGHEVVEDGQDRLGGRVAVSGSGKQVFVYADSADAAREAQTVISGLLAAENLQGGFKLERWHHEEEEWVDGDAPLPTTSSEDREEHARLEQEETAESEASGVAEWEVRVEFGSHRDARDFEARLAREGYGRFVRRWTYVLIGTNDHDDAERVAAELQGELPSGASLQVEPGSGLGWELKRGRAFAVFGGLAG